MNFDFEHIKSTEFGVGERDRNNVNFYNVPIDKGVENRLNEMAVSTWQGMLEIAETAHPYEPSNLAAGSHHLVLEIDSPMAELFKDISQAAYFQPGGTILQNPRRVFCYFARLIDEQNLQLTGMRRSSSFKGVLRQKNRFVALYDDSLQIVDDDLFRLDAEFDLLIDSNEVRILHPAGFENIARLNDMIMSAMPGHVATVRESLHFVDFDVIEEFARGRISAARLLASISTQGTEGITVESLKEACADNGIDVSSVDGRVTVEEESVMGFLQTLDRRLFNSRLVPSNHEVFLAAIRNRV